MPRDSPPDPRPGTVLLVEDEAAVRRFIASTLSREGYEVLEAANGAQALDIVGRSSVATVDLALVDVGLPGCSGSDLAKDLHAQGVPRIILMIGHSSASDPRVHARDLGWPMLHKPFTALQLRAHVWDVLSK